LAMTGAACPCALRLIAEAVGEVAVGVDAAIAEEGPPAAGLLADLGGDFGNQDFFLIAAGLGDDAAERIGHEGMAPEFKAAFFGPLMTNAVDGADEDAVGDGVGTLHGLPGADLGLAEFGLFTGVPADG